MHGGKQALDFAARLRLHASSHTQALIPSQTQVRVQVQEDQHKITHSHTQSQNHSESQTQRLNTNQEQNQSQNQMKESGIAGRSRQLLFSFYEQDISKWQARLAATRSHDLPVAAGSAVRPSSRAVFQPFDVVPKCNFGAVRTIASSIRLST